MRKRRTLSNGTAVTLKMRDDVRGWPTSSLLERLQSCRAMLAIHGFLSDSQSNTLATRLYSRAEAEAKAALASADRR